MRAIRTVLGATLVLGFLVGGAAPASALPGGSCSNGIGYTAGTAATVYGYATGGCTGAGYEVRADLVVRRGAGYAVVASGRCVAAPGGRCTAFTPRVTRIPGAVYATRPSYRLHL